MAELPTQVRRQNWQIQFLVEELRGVSTEVERNVILDWLERAKTERKGLETQLVERQALYERLMRHRRRRAAKALETQIQGEEPRSGVVAMRARGRDS